MVEILYGDYGTGKDEYILEKIRSDISAGVKCVWLVPEQRVLLCERAIATRLDPSAQLFVEVLSFSRLANRIFREYGGLRTNYVTRSGKSLIMYCALCEVGNNLEEYKLERGHERGCVNMFLDVVGELKSYAIAPQALREASDALEGKENERLKRRIHDLVRVYEAYNRLLEESYSDPYDDIKMLREKLESHAFFEGKNVYISSFFGFTGAQLAVLREIFSQASNITFSIDLEKSARGKIQNAKLTQTLNAILLICDKLEPSPKISERHFDTDLLHKTEALKHLCKSIWRLDESVTPIKNHEGITLLRPENPLEECEIVASKIKELIMSGERYSSMAIIVRNIDTYRGIIDDTLKKFDIPYFISAGVDIISKPLVKLIYSAINASVSFSARDIASFMRCGYSGIASEDADELESYMYRWGIYGHKFENEDYWSANPDGYVSEPTELQMARLAQINKTREALIEKIAIIKNAFDKKSGASDICLAIYELFTTLKVTDALKAEIADADRAGALELSQLYSRVLSALDIISNILKDRVLDQDAFLSALSYVLEGEQISTIPTGDDSVTIGEAGAVRTEGIKYAFVLGVCEGEFPATISDSPFFSDLDKQELATKGVLLSDSSSVRADSELLSFKNSISIPSHGLFVSSPISDMRGAKKEPSVAYTRILELLGLSLDDKKAFYDPLDRIYSRRVAREYASGDTPRAYAIRAMLGISDSELDFSNEDEEISPDIARELFGNSIYLSQSKIEKFVSCHFQYYCTYLLDIKESEKISFGAREVGVLAHAVFERFLKRARDNTLNLITMTDTEIESEVDSIVHEYIGLMCQGSVPSARLKHLFARLKANIVVYIRELAEEFAQSKFKPELFELPFTHDAGGVAPLQFGAGEGATITLSGVVDRVDVYRDGDTAYLRVLDYKSGEKKFTYDDFNCGLELQLLIYLFTLCKMKDSKFKRELLGECTRLAPAGVVYFPLRIGKGKVDSEVDLSCDEASEAEKKEIASLVKRSGVFLDNDGVILAQDSKNSGHYVPQKRYNKQYFLDEAGFDALYTRLEEILHKIGTELLSGNAQARPLKLKGHKSPCEYCTHKALCRRRRV